MSQTNRNQSIKTFLITVSFSLISFIVLFVALSYCLYHLPNFENYYSLFSPLLLIAEGALIVLFCRRASSNPICFTFTSALIVSVLSIVFGFSLGGANSLCLRIVVMHFVFVLAAVLFQMFFQYKKPKKRTTRTFPFKK